MILRNIAFLQMCHILFPAAIPIQIFMLIMDFSVRCFACQVIIRGGRVGMVAVVCCELGKAGKWHAKKRLPSKSTSFNPAGEKPITKSTVRDTERERESRR